MTTNNDNTDFFADELLNKLTTTPALSAAFQAQDRSAQVGFDFANIELVVKKVLEEMQEVDEAFQHRGENPKHFIEEIGDCFFALVNLCRHAGVDPEELLRENTRKYLKRCQYIEARLASEAKNWSDIPLDEIYRRWKAAKMSGL